MEFYARIHINGTVTIGTFPRPFLLKLESIGAEIQVDFGDEILVSLQGQNLERFKTYKNKK